MASCCQRWHAFFKEENEIVYEFYRNRRMLHCTLLGNELRTPEVEEKRGSSALCVSCLPLEWTQSRKQPVGISKLPPEILELVFRQLCGREMGSMRLVCTEWEQTTRPFFEIHHRNRKQ